MRGKLATCVENVFGDAKLMGCKEPMKVSSGKSGTLRAVGSEQVEWDWTGAWAHRGRQEGRAVVSFTLHYALWEFLACPNGMICLDVQCFVLFFWHHSPRLLWVTLCGLICGDLIRSDVLAGLLLVRGHWESFFPLKGRVARTRNFITCILHHLYLN